ncbi:MAG: class II fructose-bisphosphate aldolase [Crocinitomicaceae bacterium]
MYSTGGSGSTVEEIREAISVWSCEMNIDTDLQFAFTEGARDYIVSKVDYLKKHKLVIQRVMIKPNKKYYDPRKWLREGELTFIKRLEQSFADLEQCEYTLKN